MMRRRRWSDLSPGARRAIVIAATVQMALAAAAWGDLMRRPAAMVSGRKWMWSGAIAVNFVGPLAYFRWGRRNRPAPAGVRKDLRQA